jgi:glycosyltransferase involved in cell wall biosynthesis
VLLVIVSAVKPGFGLPPLEAMATGLPTIIADNTGMKDYSDDRYNYTVKFSHKSPAQRYPSNWGYVGNWYESDIKDLKAKMLEVYENQDEAREKGKLASRWVHEKWTIEESAKSIISAIEKYYNV